MTRVEMGGRGHLRAAWMGVVGALGIFVASGAALGNDAENTTVERLIEDARQAQLAGDVARQFALLREAVRVAPDHPLARWQLGQVQVDGQWLAVEEAQRRAAAEPRQKEYRERRTVQSETPQGQLELARWCRRKGLDDEAQFHWASVLSVDPGNEEALRAVDMRWQNGRLLTREEIAQQKVQLREAKQAEKRWSTTIAKWRRAVSGRDAQQREAALDEIRALTTADVIPALEKVTLGRDATDKKLGEECRQICLAFCDALANMPDEAATESLVRHAIFSPIADAKESAIEKLKERQQHEYVPLLLSGLAMPIESSFQVRTEPDGSVHYWHSLYREGADTDWAVDTRRAVMQNDFGGRRFTRILGTDTIEIGPPTGAEPRAMMRKAGVASRSQHRFGNAASATEWQVWRVNQETEALNALIIHVLKETTGQNLGDNPTDWWEWWYEQNEYYASEEKPVEKRYYSDTESHYYGQPEYGSRRPLPPGGSGKSLPPGGSGKYHTVIMRSNGRPGWGHWDPTTPRRTCRLSCFAEGTLVWTKTGHRPIETLKLGDLVLAQDVHTGELAYKPVIGRMVRPPSSIVKLSIGGEELRTTLGHPLWVSGVGWRMAKEVEDGAILQGVSGSPRVESVEADGEEEAYNLVVADFNTYFVGESGVLVHDNTPRRPTRATVPGLAAR